MHVAIAKRKSGAFDIYFNGNHIDSPINREKGTPIRIESFTVTYDKIIFDMNKKATKQKFRELKHD